MAKANRGGWKTCARGHKYRGADPCPQCWPSAHSRKPRKLLGSGFSRVAFLASLPDLKHRG